MRDRAQLRARVARLEELLLEAAAVLYAMPTPADHAVEKRAGRLNAAIDEALGIE